MSATYLDTAALLTHIVDQLKTRFGASDRVADSLIERLAQTSDIKGSKGDRTVGPKLRKFSDACLAIQHTMQYTPGLSFLNTDVGLSPIVERLPFFVLDAWRSERTRHRRSTESLPDFARFCEFIKTLSDTQCDSFGASNLNWVSTRRDTAAPARPNPRAPRVLYTSSGSQPGSSCVLHQGARHATSSCQAVRKMEPQKKKDFIRKNKLCYRCLGTHWAKHCKEVVRCDDCGADDHSTTAHLNRPKAGNPSMAISRAQSKQDVGDKQTQSEVGENPKARALNSRSATTGGRACSKTVLADVFDERSGRSCRVYAILDEQSTTSFCSSKLLDTLQVTGPKSYYTLETLSDQSVVRQGRCVSGLKIKGVSESKVFELPPMFECDIIPDSKREVATKERVERTPEIAHFAPRFLTLDDRAEVAVLLGTDSGDILYSHADQHRQSAPFVHHTALGWAVVGKVNDSAGPSIGRRCTILKTAAETTHEHLSAKMCFGPSPEKDMFVQQPDDEMPGLSHDDRKFLKAMEEIKVNDEGHLEAPLPLRSLDATLPDNRVAVFRRQENTLKRLTKEPAKLQQCLDAMKKNLDMRHVEQIPAGERNRQGCLTLYIPIFPVVQEKKSKVRLVFDSAAKYQGTSLNTCLLSGPDYNNRLRDVLTRFREHKIAFVADVESMFHAFHVPPGHKNLMRFYWWADNDPQKPLVPHRARVHVFGNTSSPAVATMCLHRAAKGTASELQPEDIEHLEAAQDYVTSHFYCDDGLGTAPDPTKAIGILRTAKYLLSRYHIRLHKIMSNSMEVLKAFPTSERATEDDIDLITAPNHSTLGVSWNIASDCFVLKVNIPDRPHTKRGLLSVINSIYDPIGFASPVTLGGRLILRNLLSETDRASGGKTLDWDELIPSHIVQSWLRWLQSLQCLHELSIPRCFLPPKSNGDDTQTLHIFSGASQEAIGNVTYLRTTTNDGQGHVAFVHGESRVAPRAATSIPRLELCAAVGAVLSSLQTIQELKRKPARVYFYSDSKVVLGYIRNDSARFSRYVQRRVDIIRQSSDPSQWSYVDTTSNPADLASRPTDPSRLMQTEWLRGPAFLISDIVSPSSTSAYPTDPEELPEVEKRADAQALRSTGNVAELLFAKLFSKFSSWSAILRIAARVVTLSQKLLNRVVLRRANQNSHIAVADPQALAHNVLVLEAQKSAFSDLFNRMRQGGSIAPRHKLSSLAPFVDQSGLIRVGGRLAISDFPEDIKHPLLLPFNHPISTAVMMYYHQKTKHQGRHVTHASIREAGYHIENGRRAIQKLLRNCVICKRLRASFLTPQMAELPKERSETAPPFTFVGFDVFGHWMINNGPSTRRNALLRKCWALLFTCLASRAVHIEMLPSLNTPTFINSFRRFIAVRGPCSVLRSDRGTNFVGAKNLAEGVDVQQASRALLDLGVRWEMNPPHASHFGGVWERKIGQIRRCLKAALLHAGQHPLSFDELHTLLQEAAAIVNSTPLWETSFDPNEPLPVTPNMLLTQKTSTPQHDRPALARHDPAYGKL